MWMIWYGYGAKNDVFKVKQESPFSPHDRIFAEKAARKVSTENTKKELSGTSTTENKGQFENILRNIWVTCICENIWAREQLSFTSQIWRGFSISETSTNIGFHRGISSTTLDSMQKFKNLSKFPSKVSNVSIILLVMLLPYLSKPALTVDVTLIWIYGWTIKNSVHFSQDVNRRTPIYDDDGQKCTA